MFLLTGEKEDYMCVFSHKVFKACRRTYLVYLPSHQGNPLRGYTFTSSYTCHANEYFFLSFPIDPEETISKNTSLVELRHEDMRAANLLAAPCPPSVNKLLFRKSLCLLALKHLVIPDVLQDSSVLWLLLAPQL